MNDSHSRYGELGTWIEQKGWQINGIGREILMQEWRQSHEPQGSELSE